MAAAARGCGACGRTFGKAGRVVDGKAVRPTCGSRLTEQGTKVANAGPEAPGGSRGLTWRQPGAAGDYLPKGILSSLR